jgi:RHS repeat-associated protein
VSQSANPTTAASLNVRFSKVHKQSFTAAGRKQTRTDPDGNGSNKAHSFTYDAAGRLATVALPPTAPNAAVGTTSGSITISGYRWNQPSEITYPNGLKQTTTHDALMRPTNIQVAPTTNPTAANTPMNFGYVFDEVSNINKITRQGRDTNYSYDTLYRLTEALPAPTTAATTNPATTNPPSAASLPTERYSYDLVHNRLTENRSGGEALTANNSNASTATPSLTDITAAYSYNGNHQIVEIKNQANSATIQSFSYSADGHTTNIATNAQIPNNIQLPERPENRTFIYDAQERLIQVSDGGNIVAMYRYDPFGRRILKTLTQAGADNANTAQAKLLASGPNTPDQTAGSTYYGYTDEGLVAEYASAGSALSSGDMLAAYGYLPNQTWQTNPAYKRDVQTGASNPDRVHLFHNDHLGSPQRLTDEQGKTSWAASFESFGRGYADASVGATPAVNSLSPTTNNHRFPGQLFDAETGLTQNFFRDYFASSGKYIQSDPVGLKGGINAFSYAQQLPIRLVDPKGLDIWAGGEIGVTAHLVLVGAGASVGAVVNVQTGETCPYLMLCPFRIGVGFQLTGGVKVGLQTGNHCGKDLSDWQIQVCIEGAFGIGAGGCLSGNTNDVGAAKGGLSFGPPGGSAAIEFCYMIVMSNACKNTPCECKDPKPCDCKK